jgi:hypothetical protein
MPTWNSNFVTLDGGVVVPIEVLEFVLGLESRGYLFRVEGDKLWVSKSATDTQDLTENDRLTISTRKPHVLLVVSYQADHNRIFVQDATGTNLQQRNALSKDLLSL